MKKPIKRNEYIVSVIIENKPFLNDPEGETILRDLILKGNYNEITEVRSAKYLKIKVKAENAKDAEKIISKMCDDLRIYNPVISRCEIAVMS